MRGEKLPEESDQLRSELLTSQMRRSLSTQCTFLPLILCQSSQAFAKHNLTLSGAIHDLLSTPAELAYASLLLLVRSFVWTLRVLLVSGYLVWLLGAGQFTRLTTEYHRLGCLGLRELQHRNDRAALSSESPTHECRSRSTSTKLDSSAGILVSKRPQHP